MADWQTRSPPGGESFAAFSERVAAWWRDLDPGNHFLMAHAGVVHCLDVVVAGLVWELDRRAAAGLPTGQTVRAGSVTGTLRRFPLPGRKLRISSPTGPRPESMLSVSAYVPGA